MQIYEILEHEVINCRDDSGDEMTNKVETKIKVIVDSELHKTTTWTKLIPYNSMIRWALENTDVQTRSMLNHQKVIVISFRPKHIQLMYKLSPDPKYIYNDAFIVDFQGNEFEECDQTYLDIIKTWWGIPTKFRANSQGVLFHCIIK
jgi:hypothetical protein